MNKIYIVLTHNFIDEDHTTDSLPCYFVNKIDAIEYMLNEAQSQYHDWRDRIQNSATLDVGINECSVEDNGDFITWSIKELTNGNNK